MDINNKNLTKQDLIDAVKNGGLAQISDESWDKLDPKILNERIDAEKEEERYTILQKALIDGRGDQIPDKFHTSENLATKTGGKNTVYIAAENDNFDQVKNLTPALLIEPTETKDTAAHLITEKDQLDDLPLEVKTQEVLFCQNEEGNSPTNNYIKNNGKFPKDFFDIAEAKDLKIENNKGENIRQTAVSHNAAGEIPEDFLNNKKKKKKPINLDDISIGNSETSKKFDNALKQRSRPNTENPNISYDSELVVLSTTFIKEKQTEKNATALLAALNDDPEKALENLKKNLSPDIILEQERESDRDAFSSLTSQPQSTSTKFHIPGSNDPKRKNPEWLQEYTGKLSKTEKNQTKSVSKNMEYHRLMTFEDVKSNLQTGDIEKVRKIAGNNSQNLKLNWDNAISNQKSGFLEVSQSAVLYWDQTDKNSNEAKMHLSTLQKAENEDTLDIFKTIENLRDNPEKAKALQNISEQLAKSNNPAEETTLQTQALILLDHKEFKGDPNDPNYEKQRLKQAMDNSLVKKYMTLDEDEHGTITNIEKKQFWDNINKNLESDINTPAGALKMLATGQATISKENADDCLIKLRPEDIKQKDQADKDKKNSDDLKKQAMGKIQNKLSHAGQKMGQELKQGLGSLTKDVAEIERGIQM